MKIEINTISSICFIDGQKTNTDYQCPNDKSGQFRDNVQCDKYYECDDGVATERLCPDGLVFDETIRLKNKCDQPFNVDCGDRTELRKLSLNQWEEINDLKIDDFDWFHWIALEPPKGTNEKCPRKNGFFAHPNPQVCNVFYNCIDGDVSEVILWTIPFKSKIICD